MTISGAAGLPTGAADRPLPTATPARAPTALAEASERSLREYGLLLGRLEALAKAVGAAGDLAGVFRALLAFVRASVPCNGLYVSLLDPDGRQRRCAFAWSEGSEEDASALPPLPLNDSPNSRAILTGDVVLTDDYQAAVAGLPSVDQGTEVNPDPARSSVCVPLAVQGRTVGAFEVQSTLPAAYSVEHVTALRAAAGVAAIAVENASLLERERSTAETAWRVTQEAREGRAWFESLVDSIEGIIWETVQDPDGAWRHSFTSRRAEAILGYPVADWAADPGFWANHLHPEDRERSERESREGIGRGEPFEVEYRMVAADGRTVWFRDLVTPDADGRRLRGVMVDVTERKLDEQRVRDLADRLAHDAHHDALTGLPNRLLFEDRLEQAIERSRRSGDATAVLFLDLDGFQRVNDTLGHHAGDALLREVAGRLGGCARSEDTLARRGGDEFLVVAENVGDALGAVRLGRRLLDALAEPVLVAGQEVFVTGSVGVAVFPHDGLDAGTLQRSADAAMYRAKANGRNRVECYAPEMNAAAAELLRLEADLRRGIERGEVTAHYQVQVDAVSGRPVGFEALARWNHPTLGLVPPGRFLPLAEEVGLIGAIDKVVLREACRQNAAWQAAGLPPVTVAVNVSAFGFDRADLAQTVRAALDEGGLDGRWLELELSETFVMSDPREAVAQIGRLRDLGVKLAIDDFGTGHSSLAYLQKLDFDTLKIDRSLVSGVARDDASRVVVEAVATLARKLGMTAVAEGVETEEQAEAVKALGCETIQGYFYGKPATATEAERAIAARS